jgi:hypothetical protein
MSGFKSLHYITGPSLKTQKEKQGVCHKGCGIAIFTLKSILRQKKKNYGNSNISAMQKYNLQKIL